MSATVLPAEEWLERERTRIAAALARSVAVELAGAGPLAAALAYAVEGGGKRLRGALCALAHRTVGARPGDGIYQVAAALELVHTYSLVHDDLPCMDADDLRRGRPTLHRVFGSAAAAAAGAALIPLAFRVLLAGARALALEAEPTRTLALMLARGCGGGGMVGGQWLDLEAEGLGSGIDLPALARIHAAKTGALFSAALGMGGVAGGGTGAQVAALAEYGEQLGLAFQVIDDLLDETGDSAALGKTAGKDRRQEKATYPALLGVAGARVHARNAVAGGLARLRAAGLESAELADVGEWVLARRR